MEYITFRFFRQPKYSLNLNQSDILFFLTFSIICDIIHYILMCSYLNLIMPDLKPDYPYNWRSISKTLRDIVGYCELCGHSPPRVPWLTVHHIDGNPSNCDLSNLFVCCPKCHFLIQRSGFVNPRLSVPVEQLSLF